MDFNDTSGKRRFLEKLTTMLNFELKYVKLNLKIAIFNESLRDISNSCIDFLLNCKFAKVFFNVKDIQF